MIPLTPSAEFLLRTLAQCGAVTVRQLAQLPAPISARWLATFARETDLVHVGTTGHRGHDIRHAVLAPDGKRLVREVLGILPYRTHPAQLVHDLTLCGFYLRLPPGDRVTWRNPEELLATVTRRYRSKVSASYPDGLYEDADGRTIVVEVAGANLTRTQIERKKTTAWAQWGVNDLVVVKAGVYADADF